MMKSSNKKRLKKDIFIKKIHGSSKYCKNMETQIVRTVTFLAQYAQIRNFIKLILKKHGICDHNLFFLGKRKQTKYLTLQEDHNGLIHGCFYFGPVGPNMEVSLKAPCKR